MNSVISVLTGAFKQLDGKSQPDESVTPDDAADTTKLAKLLTRLLKDVATLKQKYFPRTITFRDVVTGGAPAAPVLIRLTHNFGAPVEWSFVRIYSNSTTTSTYAFELPATDANTLVLNVFFSATVSIRVSEAG